MIERAKRFLGTRRLAEQVNQKRGRTPFKYSAQPAYYPNSVVGRIRAFPAIEQAAVSFFSEDPAVVNVFLIQTLQLEGINIPHYHEWIKRTGKYYEGYLQHTITGEPIPPPM